MNNNNNNNNNNKNNNKNNNIDDNIDYYDEYEATTINNGNNRRISCTIAKKQKNVKHWR